MSKEGDYKLVNLNQSTRPLFGASAGRNAANKEENN